MNRWEVNSQLGFLPSTAPNCWLEYPWAQLGALTSIQDVEDNNDDDDDEEFCEYHFAGKWMLYYRLEELDDIWKDACELFEAGEFKHVHHIRIGSFKPNIQSPPGKRCLMFHCSSTDPQIIMEAGISIARSLKYSVCCYYRTNWQSKQPHIAGVKRYSYFIRPEMHNADPSWILERFFPEA